MKPSRTQTSLAPDPSRKPEGVRSIVDPKTQSTDKQRAIRRENEAADTLAQAGYGTKQNPFGIPESRGATPMGKYPDYEIEGEHFDCYAPRSSNDNTILKGIRDKVSEDQAYRIVVNLDDSNVSLDVLRERLTRYTPPKLEEVIIIKNGNITSFYPFEK